MEEINCKVTSSDLIRVDDVSSHGKLVDIVVFQRGHGNTVSLNLKGVKKLRKVLKRAQKELEDLECD